MWADLFKQANYILERSGITEEEWLFGGGSALALIFQHRESNDVDIFFSDAQLLTIITPRLNRIVAELTDDYSEGSSFLKLKFPDGEIDFIVAPHLIPNGYFVVMPIAGKKVRVEIPEEVVLKKLFYRAEALKTRDIVDTAVVYLNRKESLLANISLIKPKIWYLRHRLAIIHKIYRDEIKQMIGLDLDLGKNALDIFEAFLVEAERICNI